MFVHVSIIPICARSARYNIKITVDWDIFTSVFDSGRDTYAHSKPHFLCSSLLLRTQLCSSPHGFPCLRSCVIHEQLSYSVGSSLYFSTKKREASFDNLEDVAIKKLEAKLKSAHGKDLLCRMPARML